MVDVKLYDWVYINVRMVSLQEELLVFHELFYRFSGVYCALFTIFVFCMYFSEMRHALRV